ncbi:MAG: helix-turn-helix transcriptional regulator [Candidatus Korobacteraceae bacterium]|jgi:transcriptional regulator with XRE-family HTH domain
MEASFQDGFRDVRKMLGFSQQRLAGKTGISQSRISAFENGHLSLGAEELGRLGETVIRELQAKAPTLLQLVQAAQEPR